MPANIQRRSSLTGAPNPAEHNTRKYAMAGVPCTLLVSCVNAEAGFDNCDIVWARVDDSCVLTAGYFLKWLVETMLS